MKRIQLRFSLGSIALAVLILGKLFLKNKPVALFVVIGAIVAASALSLDTRGVKLLGNVPQGLPPLGMPAIHWDDLNQLLALAFACFLWVRSKLPPSAECLSRNMAAALTPTRNFLHLLHQTLPLESAVVFPSAEGCHSPSSMKVLGSHTTLKRARRRHHSYRCSVLFTPA
jgi:Sulfate permease and related transporters (MFS superfamily)